MSSDMDRMHLISSYVSMHRIGLPDCLFIDGVTNGGPQTNGTGFRSEGYAPRCTDSRWLRLRLSDDFRNAGKRATHGGVGTPVLMVPDIHN
jgi:hypothetical protein